MAAGVEFRIDSADYDRLARAFRQLPEKMQSQVLARAFGRSRSVVERTYARLASARMDIAQKHVKARMRSHVSGGDLTLIVRSRQIPLDELNAKQRARGVFVPQRGTYRSAFIATGGVGRGRVLKRKGAARFPTMRLFGPNPAGEATRNPKVYEQMLTEIARGTFFAELSRGISYMLGRL
ncbi:hypothetical protein [Jiella marina]|uniref:hypothetical protein n=1 Tax=Jiella sp. LLJ827 TaxID=2917712 RepID=UPI002100C24D|nr:hypothetical protein [Jiella sp. LLJ827]MCQ0986414.1 hypothetical protein [Jiella sp. LLJ827]